MVTPKTAATTNPTAGRKRFAPASLDDACSLYAKRWPGALALVRALRDQGVVLQDGAPADE